LTSFHKKIGTIPAALAYAFNQLRSAPKARSSKYLIIHNKPNKQLRHRFSLPLFLPFSQIKMKVLIVGAGVFGLSVANELADRGHHVVVFDRFVPPAVDGSSNDISRIVRMDYGADELFTKMAYESLRKWPEWNNLNLKSPQHRQLFSNDGIVLMMKGTYEKDAGYEKESYELVKKFGLPLERLSQAQGNPINKKFPVFEPDLYKDGYFNAFGGWADAGETVTWLAYAALQKGVVIRSGNQGEFRKMIQSGNVVQGIETMDGTRHFGDLVLVAAGAWSPSIVPELDGLITAIGHPVGYFKIPPTLQPKFRAPSLPVFAADISRTGWYGFPLSRNGTLLKVGNHSNGYIVQKKLEDGRICSVPDASIPFPQLEAKKLVEFAHAAFPDLRMGNVTLEKTRLCWYCESWDSKFYIDRVPGRQGLMVACGSSGHGFKFAPMIGEVIADAIENKENEYGKHFKWRVSEQSNGRTFEACRFIDAPPTILSKI